MWCGRATPIYPFLYKNVVNNKEIPYLSIWAYMGGGRKSGRGTPILCFLLVLYCTMIPLKIYHCSFFRFIFMTYCELKCSKTVDFSIPNKPYIREIFLPSFVFLARSVRPLSCFQQTDRRT